MMPSALGTVALLTSFPGSGFSISPLILRKISAHIAIDRNPEDAIIKYVREHTVSFGTKQPYIKRKAY